MKTKSYHKQRGVASLLTAVVLLTCITLVVLFTSKTVVTDTKMTADNYRTAQATAAAQAALDQGVAYALDGGIDQDNSGARDYIAPAGAQVCTALPANAINTTPFSLSLTSGGQTTYAQFYFDVTAGNRCDNAVNCAGGTCFPATDKALVIATGWSDDCTATRTVSICVGSFNIVNKDPKTGGAPIPSPLVGASTVNVRGNAHVINRFTNANIWSGDAYSLNGSSLKTFLRKPGTSVSDFSLDELISDIPSNDSLSGTPSTYNCTSSPTCTCTGCGVLSNYTIGESNKDTGNGNDIIDNDETLAKVTFQTFFSQTLSDAITTAQGKGRCYASGTTIVPANMPGETGTKPAQPCTGGGSVPNPTTKGNLIVTDGNVSLPTVLGSPSNPVILIVNGDFHWTGGTIYGLLYVTGELHMGGTATLVGSGIAQTPNPPNGTGAGSPTVIYRPFGGSDVDKNGNPAGYNLEDFTQKGIVSGSWRDW